MQRTGLAARLRTWARERGDQFAFHELAEALGNPRGKPREKLRNNLDKFIIRGEIKCVAVGKYLYVQGWRLPVKGKTLPKILKAMYLTTEWSANDIKYFAGTENRNFVHRTIARLLAGGHVRKKGHRKPIGGKGKERVYEVMDRERFRKEIL